MLAAFWAAVALMRWLRNWNSCADTPITGEHHRQGHVCSASKCALPTQHRRGTQTALRRIPFCRDCMRERKVVQWRLRSPRSSRRGWARGEPWGGKHIKSIGRFGNSGDFQCLKCLLVTFENATSKHRNARVRHTQYPIPNFAETSSTWNCVGSNWPAAMKFLSGLRLFPGPGSRGRKPFDSKPLEWVKRFSD